MIKSNKITIKINKKELSDDYLPELSKAKSKTPVSGGGALDLDGKITKVTYMNGILNMGKWKFMTNKEIIKALIIQKLKKKTSS